MKTYSWLDLRRKEVWERMPHSNRPPTWTFEPSSQRNLLIRFEQMAWFARQQLLEANPEKEEQITKLAEVGDLWSIINLSLTFGLENHRKAANATESNERQAWHVVA